jgi:hypothetical protein
MQFAKPIDAAWTTDAVEQDLAPITPSMKRELNVPIRPHQILTVRIRIKSGAMLDPSINVAASDDRGPEHDVSEVSAAPK